MASSGDRGPPQFVHITCFLETLNVMVKLLVEGSAELNVAELSVIGLLGIK